MKIHSKFRDYYDIGMRYDEDPTPRFVRNEAQITPLSGVSLGLPCPTWDSWGFVLFCGRKYPFYRIYGIDEVFYSPEKMIKELQKRVKYPIHVTYKQLLNTLQAKGERAKPRYGQWHLCLNSWQGWLDDTANQTIPPATHLAYQAPIIVVDSGLAQKTLVTTNANLSRYNFQSVMDPYTAYQELSMYLGNQMADTQMVPAPMTDELKIHAHGFDKWSFRTHPEDSKKRKREPKQKWPTGYKEW